MKKASRTASLAAGFVLFFFGIAVTIGWNIVGWLGGSRLSKTEFPFGIYDDLTVTVDSVGRIYVGDCFHRRIQRYSPMGQFELGWFVDVDGIFVLRTSADDLVEVAAARREGPLTYTGDGQLLTHVMDDDAYSRYSALPETSGQYRIKGWFLPRVIDKRTERTVVATPWAERLVATPFPSFAYSGLGVALIAVSEWQRRRGLEKLNRDAAR